MTVAVNTTLLGVTAYIAVIPVIALWFCRRQAAINRAAARADVLARAARRARNRGPWEGSQ